MKLFDVEIWNFSSRLILATHCINICLENSSFLCRYEYNVFGIYFLSYFFLFWYLQPRNLLKYRGLRFVTSSVEKKELAMKAEKKLASSDKQEAEPEPELGAVEENKNTGYRISASSAYQIAASAASYLHSHTKSIIPFKSSKADGGEASTDSYNRNDETLNKMNSDVASLMATTDSVTAVVAAKEEVKQAVADDLKSTSSSPCEWFICDDDQTSTRFFVIQVGFLYFFVHIYFRNDLRSL